MSDFSEADKGSTATGVLENAMTGAAAPESSASADSTGVLEVLREWADLLIIAYVLAMFLRVFLVELFRIPTGSMTPTLIGGEVAEIDYDGDGLRDLVLLGTGSRPLYFRNDGDGYRGQGEVRLAPRQIEQLRAQGHVRHQYDRILVNKIAYWFEPPGRGDVIVFKVPDRIYEPGKEIYIKRCAGLPGETLTFDREGHLEANGKRVKGPFFEHQRYQRELGSGAGLERRPGLRYGFDRGEIVLERVEVPDDMCTFMLFNLMPLGGTIAMRGRSILVSLGKRKVL